MTTYTITADDFHDYIEPLGNSSDDPFSSSISTQIRSMVPQILLGNWGNLSLPLESWQQSQLENLEEAGIRCLLNMWFLNQQDQPQGLQCNATWDNVFCWPATSPGKVVTRPCSEILKETEPSLAHHIQGEQFAIVN